MSEVDWAATRLAPLGCDEIAIHDDGDGLEIVVYPDAASRDARRGMLGKYKLSFPDDIIGVIAVANAALPDDDPRKFAHADVYDLRALIADLRAGNDLTRLTERTARLAAFADALESYLPPSPSQE